MASSLVGDKTNMMGLAGMPLIGLSYLYSMWARAGRENARVLPEPVSAIPIISLPLAIIGQHCACMGVGVVNPLHTDMILASRQKSLKDLRGLKFSASLPVITMLCWALNLE